MRSLIDYIYESTPLEAPEIQMRRFIVVLLAEPINGSGNLGSYSSD